METYERLSFTSVFIGILIAVIVMLILVMSDLGISVIPMVTTGSAVAIVVVLAIYKLLRPKIIQIIKGGDNEKLYALSSDGTIWQGGVDPNRANGSWRKIESPPEY